MSVTVSACSILHVIVLFIYMQNSSFERKSGYMMLYKYNYYIKQWRPIGLQLVTCWASKKYEKHAVPSTQYQNRALLTTGIDFVKTQLCIANQLLNDMSTLL